MTGKAFEKVSGGIQDRRLLIVVAPIWAFFAILTYDLEMGRLQFLTARNFPTLRQMVITGMLASAMVCSSSLPVKSIFGRALLAPWRHCRRPRCAPWMAVMGYDQYGIGARRERSARSMAGLRLPISVYRPSS